MIPPPDRVGVRVGGLILVLLSSLTGCGSDVVYSSDLNARIPAALLGSSQCNLTGLPLNAVANFSRYWDQCYAVITVGVDPTTPSGLQSGLAQAIQSALAVWNMALVDSGQAPGGPRFAYAPPGGVRDVSVLLTTSGAAYCGATPSNSLIQIRTSNCPTNSSNLTNTLVHELGHALGFDSGEHGGHLAGVSSHCAMHLTSISGINGSVCQHEVEKVYAAYGIVPLGGVQVADFYARHVVTGLSVSPSSLTLTVGQAAGLTASLMLLARAYPGFGSLPVGSVSLAWSPDHAAIATVNGAGTVMGVQVGSTAVRARITASQLPVGYQAGGLFGQHGQAVQVAVQPVGPPGPGFAVSDISGVPQPVTIPGSYTFQAAVLQGGDPATLQVQWTFAPSYPGADTITTAYGPLMYAYVIPAGSYRVRVTARPRNGGSIGAAYIEDFPVCTGGAALLAPEDPDAVGGC